MRKRLENKEKWHMFEREGMAAEELRKRDSWFQISREIIFAATLWGDVSKARQQVSEEEIPGIKMWREPAPAMCTHKWIGQSASEVLYGTIPQNENTTRKWRLKEKSQHVMGKNEWQLLINRSTQRERQLIRRNFAHTQSPRIFLCTITATGKSWVCLLCC